jgi:hypothetical protein
MKSSRGIVASLALLSVLPAAVARLRAQCAGRAWGAELFTGSAWHLPMPLEVELPEGRTEFRARYGTRPFTGAPYYSYRIGRSWASGRAVEVEMLHNKLYLENPRPPIERFEVSHGYNQPTVNVVRPARGWQLRIGLGVVVAHPEGRIAGRLVSGGHTLLGRGYHIAGATVQAALGRRYVLWGERVALTAAPEVKLTASWASIPIERGRVSMPDISLHALGGLGVWRCG